MVANPCICGCSLQTASKIVAIIEMVWSGLVIAYQGISLLGFLVLLAGTSSQEYSSQDEETRAAIAFLISIAIISILIYAVYFILAIVLLMGANAYDLGKCRIWFIIMSIFVIITILLLIGIVALFAVGGFAVGLILLFLPAIELLYHLFELWVVYAFMEEIKSGSGGRRTHNMGVVYTAPSV